MKQIELTEDHKQKLLEMCREFYPEYFNVSVIAFFQGKTMKITKSPYFDSNCIGFPYKAMGNIDPYITHYWIHWFEFCMTYLAKKIIKGYDENTTEDEDINEFDLDYRIICLKYLYPKMHQHPVEYLYEQFKKLK